MKTKLMALEALKFYVAEDDVIESMEGNEYWVDGKIRAESAIAALEADIAKPVEPVALLSRWISDPELGAPARVIYSVKVLDFGKSLPTGDYMLYTTPQESAAAGWMPIETAPEDGTYILLGSADGSWIARYYPKYTSGYRPENPWQSMMLNHEHMGRFPKAKPTHWMPLPAAPGGAA